MKQWLFSIFLLLSLSLSAQTGNGLSAEDNEEIKEQAKMRLEEFTNYLTFIMSKSYDDDIKDEYIRMALNLFLGNGYSYRDSYGNEIPAPKIQVSSLYHEPLDYPVPVYLNRAKELRYDTIELTSGQIEAGDIFKIDTDKYEIALSWIQTFIGRRGEMVIYADKTKKSVKLFIMHRSGIWDIRLGDIFVDKTTKMVPL